MVESPMSAVLGNTWYRDITLNPATMYLDDLACRGWVINSPGKPCRYFLGAPLDPKGELSVFG